MFLLFFLLLLGLGVLLLGAEMLVRGASSISKKLGIPSIVIGLTIVSFGTSAPELIINIFSAFKGSTDLALGNVIGSNITNILLILGTSALIIDLKVQKNTTWKEIPFAALAVLVIFVMANDRLFNHEAADVIVRADGLIMLMFFTIFMYYTYELTRVGVDNKDNAKDINLKSAQKDILKLSRKGTGNVGEGEVKIYSGYVSFLMVVGGILGLFWGGKLLVDNAINLADLAGWSEMLIGLTIVAVGTSLPELATSLLAARKGQSDIVIGNVVGSNIFNIFWILGVTSTINPIPVSLSANFDIIFSLIATIVLFITMFIGKRHLLQRWQGGVFLLFYFLYIVYLIFRG